MTFSNAMTEFAGSLPGTDAYVKLRQAMQLLIKEDAENAVVYFLIFGFARAYVMLYEDQEVSPQFAEDNQKVMLGYLNILGDALKQHDKAHVYNAMNLVVNQYENSKKVF
ncbi:hypothetical protein RHO15_02890 [Utexia brackfieldae]|uniref:hypothetical protein n=1 Tax=Utexia brackfieldae TaxID=3074108 RepID=UPI00370D2401